MAEKFVRVVQLRLYEDSGAVRETDEFNVGLGLADQLGDPSCLH